MNQAKNNFDTTVLTHLEELIKAEKNQEIESFVIEHLANDLLGDDALQTARIHRLVLTVILLATLGQENIQQPNDRAAWLNIYQSITQKQIYPLVQNLEIDNPIRLATEFIVNKDKNKIDSLKFKPEYKIDTWIPAIEISLDFSSYEFIDGIFNAKISDNWDDLDWLMIVKSILPRLNQIYSDQNSQNMGSIIELIYHKIPKNEQTLEASQWLASAALDLYEKGKNNDKIIEMADFIDIEYFQLNKYNHLMMAHGKKGDLEKSIDSSDQIIKLLNTPTQLDQVLKKNNTKHSQADGEMFKNNLAIPTLQDLTTILNKAGLEPFLIFGSLLGHIRENSFLQNDKDIDIGIIGWENQFEIVASLLESKLFTIVTNYSLKADKIYYLSVRHTINEFSIDIFFFRSEGNKYITGIDYENNLLLKYQFTPFNLKQTKVKGVDIFIPENYELNLTETYGNWKTPDQSFITQIESPALINKGNLEHQLSIRIQILLSIRFFDLAKFEKCLLIAKKYQNHPKGMSHTLLKTATDIKNKLILIRNENINQLT